MGQLFPGTFSVKPAPLGRAAMDERAEIVVPARVSGLSDEEIVARVRCGETALFEVIMRRYNQRLYRAACHPA